MLKHLAERLPFLVEVRAAVGELGKRADALREKLSKLEQRAEGAEKRLAKLEGDTEKFAPMLTAVMREGVPLEIFTRVALLEAGYTVRGNYPYRVAYPDGVVERSIDVYALRDRKYTVPADQGRMAGMSWPERDHILVEAKQRRAGVTWVFCALPSSEGRLTAAPQELPHVNFGFELRPGETGPKQAGNMKDVEGGLAQLEYAYLPKLAEIQMQWSADHKQFAHLGPAGRFQSGARRDTLWSVLVTNARLLLFKPPTTLAALEKGVSEDSALFVEAPWLVYKGAPSLHLQEHQQRNANPVRAISKEPATELAVILAEHSTEIHVVSFEHLPRFLQLVEDPPRIKEVVLKLSIDGKESPPVHIRP